jgi:S-DNA-T family DNA segregation ATPase FtsK/SpoIIIE
MAANRTPAKRVSRTPAKKAVRKKNTPAKRVGVNARRKAAEKKQQSSASARLSRAAETIKTKAKTGSGRKVVHKANESENARLLAGWFLLALSLTAFFSLVASGWHDGAQHLLGDYLGTLLANALQIAFGRLPAIFFVTSLVFFSISLLLYEKWKEGFRIALILFLLQAELSILLTMRLSESIVFSNLQAVENGGHWGRFLVDFLIMPVFGRINLGAWFFSSLALVITLLLGFPRLRHWLVDKSIKLFSSLREQWANRQQNAEEGLSTRQIEKAQKKEKRKAESSDESGHQRDLLPHSGPRPLDFDKLRRSEGKPAVNKATPPPSVEEDGTQEITDILDPAIDPDSLSPRELRQLRDALAEEQRIRELNDWEDKKKEGIAIEGMLAKNKSEVRAIENDDKTQLMQAKTPADQKKKKASLDTGDETQPSVEQVPLKSAEKPIAIKSEATAPVQKRVLAEENASLEKTTEIFDEYQLPDISTILPDTPEQVLDYSEEELNNIGRALELQLANFKVRGKVIGVCTGPVVTRFEVELAPGVKVSRVAGLSDDLALALKAKSLRLLAPIPGKSAVGIEIPNAKPHIVYARDILESDAFRVQEDEIRIVLGKDIAGDPYAMNLAKAPHLLIAGQTGSGKSVCINTLMASVLASKTPDDLRMILVDPKVVELKLYENIPHLLHPVVTDPGEAVQALQWACWEMDRRYEVLAQAKVRNIAGYNKKFREGKLAGMVAEEENKKMPFLVIVIDELADLMMVAGKDVEISIARIAQKARAVGIHLVLATQRPSTNVITGVIKANLPTRISFKVASHIDARTILDKAGAEKLLGRGDMLFRPIEDPEPVRVHGAFLDDEEAESLADACGNQNVNYPQLDSFLFAGADGDAESAMEDAGPRDDFFHQAAELVVHSGNGSVSMLQRRLSVGHARAGRIMDQLEHAGVVGPSRGSKSREILMDEDEIRSFLSGDADFIALD